MKKFGKCYLSRLFSTFRGAYKHKNYVLGQGSAQSIQINANLSRLFLYRGLSTTYKEGDFVDFRSLLQFRRKQAQTSVLIELASKEDSGHVCNICKQFGGIKQFFSYNGEGGIIFLLAEFKDKESCNQFLNSCQYQSAYDSFCIYSHFVKYEKLKKQRNNPSRDVTDTFGQPKRNSIIRGSSIPEVMVGLYEAQKLSDLSTRLRFLFAYTLERTLIGIFPHAVAFPFGSSVNGFGKEGCDLDVMYRLYPRKMNEQSEVFFQNKNWNGDRPLQQRAILALFEILRSFYPGIGYIQRIINARIPILKFNHKYLDLDCDISINNMTAVLMSEVLHFCGEIDERVRPLVFTVKKWAKELAITYEHPGSWITNFSLTLLVLFFLQNRPVPILPPLSRAVVCHDSYEYCDVQYIQNPVSWQTMATKNSESLDELLPEFLRFLATFSFKDHRISLLTGQAHKYDDKFVSPLFIQYPLQEDMNVAKNVSVSELGCLCDLAAQSLRHLETNCGKTISDYTDLMSALGILELKSHRDDRIDVNTFYEGNDKGATVAR